jgi:hypothetical protein
MKGTKAPDINDVPVIESPSKKGSALARYLIKDDSQIDALNRLRKKTTCRQLNP